MKRFLSSFLVLLSGTTLVLTSCETPTGHKPAMTPIPTPVLQAGTATRLNKAGDDYFYSISGYYTNNQQTTHLGTISGTAEVSFVSDSTRGPNLLKQTLVMKVTLNTGQTSTNTSSSWYTPSGTLYWDSQNGLVISTVGADPATPSVGLTWVVSHTYLGGATDSTTFSIQSIEDVTCPYGLVKGTWKTQVTSSSGTVGDEYVVPSIGAPARIDITSVGSTITLYPTLLLSSYSLAP